ncbi:hypothetical protein EMPS_03951 [Entomortierella parvispora]|uniref:Uncharacterized protein n=1 Tax=Entomortierella parvispora TaxID=205924 RepID=A0A9P3H7L3_9FUNG|nr:hypothetical protein EMPS_03951 [Entomortierella parvispora]
MAMLQWVQLQVLAADDTVLIEGLDNSTRESWDLKRAKNVTWTVPHDWAEGDYILRAFGNGSYPCTENGHRTFCQFPMEDRETIHLHVLPEGQSCPQSLVPSSAPTVSSPTSLSAVGSEDEDAQIKSDGEEGFSTPLHIHIDPSVLALLQQQNEARHDNLPTSRTGSGLNSTKAIAPTTNTAGSDQGHVQEKKKTQTSEASKELQASFLTLVGGIMASMFVW